MARQHQGKEKYRGCKEYDSQYIWGQLVGWFKQTVDKPNASLSADRRGTLSIPDVQSFIADGNKYSLESDRKAEGGSGSQSQGPKKKKGRKDRESAEEVMPVKTGTRSRPARDAQADVGKQQITKSEHNEEMLNGGQPQGQEDVTMNGGSAPGAPQINGR